MAKRKREDDASPSAGDSDTDRIRTKLRKVIAHGITRLTSALETARRFERQKLGKRQQQYTQAKNDVDGRRINVEIAVLKGLNMKEIATHKLHKDLVKTNSIQKTGLLPEEVVLPKAGVLDKTTSDLMARLFKQRGVGEAVEGTMTAVREVLGLQVNGAAKKQRTGAKDSEPKANVDVKQKTASVLAWGGDQDNLEHSQAEDISGSEEDEFMGFSSRVASASDSDSEAESENDEDQAAENELARARARRKASVSLSPSPSPSEDEEAPTKSNRKSTISKAAQPTSSAFLPSLSMGGYMSASDSDATDVEDHIAPRKNRRGQRARQAIWEKKFKEKAKHLKDPPASKGKGKKDKRGDGWDAQRGAVGGNDRKGGRFGKGPSGGNAMALGKDRGMKTGVVKEKPKEKHRDDAGALHPSWEAKKVAKQQNLGIGGFKGKKMTFD